MGALGFVAWGIDVAVGGFLSMLGPRKPPAYVI